METYWKTWRIITSKFHYIVTEITGFVTIVYGPQTIQQKLEFIEYLRYISILKENNHSIIGGDFNMITSMEEKKGGMKHLEENRLAFNQMMHI